jgi:hypothetical protein
MIKNARNLVKKGGNWVKKGEKIALTPNPYIKKSGPPI